MKATNPMRYLSIVFLLAASAAADDLILKDGTTLSGQVVEEAETDRGLPDPAAAFASSN